MAYVHFRVLMFITSAMFLVTSSMAQDKGIDIEIGVKDKEWYQEPWAWIVGAAIFVLLLVAILRGGRKER